jgi:hypothetical protein
MHRSCEQGAEEQVTVQHHNSGSRARRRRVRVRVYIYIYFALRERERELMAAFLARSERYVSEEIAAGTT